METVEGRNQPPIPPNQIKLLKFVDEEGEDRISVLPDCLLLEILSRLPSSKYAVRTGKLSKRWKHLWTFVPTLIFKHNRDDDDFVLFVDKTLSQCHQLKLKKFVVYTVYDIRFESQVKNWIRYAITCKVEELHLTLRNTEFKSEFVLDQYIFTNSCFTDLTLKGCMFNPTGTISWKNLRKLCIYYVKLNTDLTENILSGSPQLETMVLEDCYGFSLLDIASKSVKNLVLSGYVVPYDESESDIIRINAPNILSLTIEAELVLWKLLLVNVSSLVKANLDYINDDITSKEEEEEMLKGFIISLCHVKELTLGVFCSKVVSRLEAKGFVSPSNMKLPDIISHLYPDDDSLEHDDWSDSD
ncbi:hypothetical protein Lser_V15G32379 [Lactuca serriola]